MPRFLLILLYAMWYMFPLITEAGVGGTRFSCGNEVGVILYICAGTYLVSLLIPIVFGFAVLFFLWGIARFLIHAADEEARREGRRVVLWGIIALFVASSIWGLVGFLDNAFDLGQGGILTPDPRAFKK